MLRFVLSSFCIVAVSAGGYSSGGGYGGNGGSAYGVPVRAAHAGGYSGGAARGSGAVRGAVAYGNGGGYGGNYAIPASIQTTHNIEYRDVPSSGYIQPATVEVGANAIPVNIFFRSASSILNVQQVHEGAQGTFHQSQSEDEPHRLVHQVTKPIFQEVREIVTPFRRIVQEIKPVQEQVNTIVARGGSRTVLADNTGSFVSQNGGVVGTVSSSVVGSSVEDVAPVVQQIIEQQQITDADSGDAGLVASDVNDNVQQVQQVQEAIPAVAGDGY